jgi:HD-GYP domain-containing protein (c-di-GMP phosphodiesterase class II)
MHLDDYQAKALYVASTLHDIGKFYVPSEILAKPGKLSDAEMNMVREHPATAFDIIKQIAFPWPVAEIILQHHERINGSGYPHNLAGDKIMLEAKILAVADVVEAIASHRPYRPALGIDKALEEIEQNRGILYDAEAVDMCLKLCRHKGFTFAMF